MKKRRFFYICHHNYTRAEINHKKYQSPSFRANVVKYETVSVFKHLVILIATRRHIIFYDGIFTAPLEPICGKSARDFNHKYCTAKRETCA